VLAAAGAVTAALGGWYRVWLGGITGDTLGAAVEVCDALVLVLGVGLGAR
jgi:cobalamin synthase